MNRIKAAILAVFLCGFMAVTAVVAKDYLDANYGSVALGNTNVFTVAFTNGSAASGQRIGLASVMVTCSTLTNTVISVVNNGQTHVIKTSTSGTALYEGYGTIPVGAGGVVSIAGVNSAVSGTVYWVVNTLVK